MNKGCIFVGGVHGSGKTQLCKKIQEIIPCKYISASQLLHWEKKEKKVENVQGNQFVLKKLLEENTQKEERYLIDGHFALWNNNFECEKVPLYLFENLNLKCIIVVEANIDAISGRLLLRDNKMIEIEKIRQLKEAERENAELVAQNLNIPIYSVVNLDTNQIVDLINSIGNFYGEQRGIH